jgi:hypothetical protein
VLVEGSTHIAMFDHEVLGILRLLEEEAALILVNGNDVPTTISLPPFIEPFITEHVSNAIEPQASSQGIALEPRDSKFFLLRPTTNTGSIQSLKALFRKPKSVLFRIASLPELGPQEKIFITGSGPELGSWQASAGAGPFEKRNTAYQLSLQLPVGGLFAYKLVVHDQENEKFRWLDDDNRYFFVSPEPGPQVITAAIAANDII